MSAVYLLAIDQGTTSSRAIVFARDGSIVGSAQREFRQYFPAEAWVEHDADEIWRITLAVCRDALTDAGVAANDIAGCGITNQRETTVIWDRATGRPVHRAIVWQDRRTADWCREHGSDEREAWLQARTGLLLDPYFSATKIRWLLDNVDGVRERAEAGELAFGTIDTWLLWQLTNGRAHATDASNASRTLLFNIHTQDWDDELLAFFGVPRALLPDVHDNAADFGRIDADHLDAAIPIGGMVGDQQGALVGQACFEPGMVKSTYGTGCFLVLNLGREAVTSRHRLLTTVGYRLNGETTYALEGSIFVAGAAVQWLRDALHLIEQAPETQAMAESIDGTDGVYLVPAFTGLGAPYWDPAARGAIFGLTRDTGIKQIVRAALESTCYQTRDLVEVIGDDAVTPTELRVDGGMVANDWVCRCLADVLQIPVARPGVIETTALGAAYLAGLQVGVYDSLAEIGALWQAQQTFAPQRDAAAMQGLYEGWLAAVQRVRSG
ncbi:glycerol kinase GlpK [Salinisphaera sp. P385]|uniref:Glycerol kinase n=1 Tax=Spectribacter acetivorans TaxID=3075603 RepID=A0ABU3BB06_9GAMM|nr:glycerol kinase GlpK [Salinisphaera sp. P385]MDT0619656.1 glycerol kinase GlpK [Salinisphaera sp. P385]